MSNILKFENLNEGGYSYYLVGGISLFHIVSDENVVHIQGGNFTLETGLEIAEKLTEAIKSSPVHNYQNGEIVRLHDCVTQTGLNYGGIVVGFIESFVKVLWVKWSIVNELPFQSNEIASTLIKLPRKN